MSALSLASARLSKQCLNDLLDKDLYKNFFYFRIISFVSGFRHDFIKCIDFTRIAASNRASNYVTN